MKQCKLKKFVKAALRPEGTGKRDPLQNNDCEFKRLPDDIFVDKVNTCALCL